MTRRLIPFVALAVTVGVAGVFRLWNGPRPATAIAAEVRPSLISAAEDRLNFGDMWEDEHFAWTIPVTNIHHDPIQIEAISTSCTCAVAEPRTFALTPGQTREVRLTLNLVPRTGEPTNEPRSFSTNVTFTTTAKGLGAARETLVISGRVLPVLELRPREPSFGETPDRVQPPPPITFAVAPQVHLQTLSAISETPGYQAAVLPPEIESPGELLVRVTPTTTKPAGPMTATVRLEPLGPNGEPLPPRRVTVRGRVAADVTVDPPQVSFSGRTVGESGEETLTVSSRTGRTLNLERVTVQGEGLNVERLPSGGLRVRQIVATAGEIHGRVELVVRPEGDGPVTVTVPVIGYGTSR
jgi:hypothetical protein